LIYICNTLVIICIGAATTPIFLFSPKKKEHE
jgi:hypothetical protein